MSSGIFGGNASLEQKKEAGDAVHRVNKEAGAHSGSRGRGRAGTWHGNGTPVIQGKGDRRGKKTQDSRSPGRRVLKES